MWLEELFCYFFKTLNYIPLFHILKDMLITAKFDKCEKAAINIYAPNIVWTYISTLFSGLYDTNVFNFEGNCQCSSNVACHFAFPPAMSESLCCFSSPWHSTWSVF